jgi:hypothetical protein
MVDGLATYTEMDEKYIPVGSIIINIDGVQVIDTHFYAV